MKTRRLSEIDLARLAAITQQPMLEQALRAYNAGGGAWSYNPVRASTSDILGATTPLIGPLETPPWVRIKRQIEAACTRGEVQARANTQVGKVLFDTARREVWSAVKFPMGYLPIGFGDSVRYWNDVVLEDKDGLFIPFFDHRREHGIANPSARQIVYSMQNLWIRDRFPDLAAARLVVIRFPTLGDDRGYRFEDHHEMDLLTYEELDARIRNVYETWARISQEKAQAGRRAGGAGSLI